MTMPINPALSFDDMTDSQKMLVLSLAINNIQNDVKKHHEVLITGNGDLPLLERIRNMEAFINSIKYWMRLLVGAILLQTVAFAAAAIAYFIRLYPLLEKLTNSVAP